MRYLLLIAITGLFAAGPAGADQSPAELECLRGFLETGADHLTLGEMRRKCRDSGTQKALDDSGESGESPGRAVASRRLEAERQAAARPFSILAHKPNYVLFGAWNEKGWNIAPYADADTGQPGVNDDIEAQFQISLKVPLAIDLLDGRMDLYAAYTNRSFWQMYNSTWSEPFRETNHEPEVWAQFRNDWRFLGLTNVINSVGWVHQSNGQSDPWSRSWNRVYANMVFEKQNFAFSIKPWIWISKDKADSDNPDITDYMGHGELRVAWKKRGHVFSTMLRNQLESGFEEGAFEFGWSFPVFDYPYLKGYVQYFYGYGESLIDYDQKVNRIGLGISLTDWLE